MSAPHNGCYACEYVLQKSIFINKDKYLVNIMSNYCKDCPIYWSNDNRYLYTPCSNEDSLYN